ncbi:pyridoxine-5'-phosphate oxidase-like isoform X2 [Pomacea canaliculata]|uniref:pyridoxine-5'-phosphate oxidase-like isoform X2 n=1 Tax=Pomacea canaliculata TaxID=400727 RepID=UPI000D72B93C|nr:pyridoxine-5'-phosphate oxidase-like isoform X2 [Pomacea canaliculata]
MSSLSDVSMMRHPYHNKRSIFDERDLVAKEPYAQFQKWFEEVCKTNGIMEPNAMTVATATKEGKPSVRPVLMKGFDKNGFVFYTNYGSRKAKELEENPNCCLMFYWEPLKRAVRIEGRAERISQEESLKYFHSRPRESQLGAIVSQQSTVISSREVLDKKLAALQEKYADESIPIPKPDYWGGYLIVPDSFEFWQGQTNRLHDRLRFRRPVTGEVLDPELTKVADDGWLLERLAP